MKIKMRAWLKKEKMMVDVLKWLHNGRIGVSIQDSGPFIKQPDEIEVMLYTGLSDRYGKEIWEGDILCFVPMDSPKFRKPFKPFEVFWREEEARFCDWSPKDTVEVIGNIYENPELLEKEKNDLL